jgi:poly(3-hydroxybutyrate) depolymerase
MHKYLRLFVFTSIIAAIGCGKGTILPAVSYVCPPNRFIVQQFAVNMATVTYTQATDYQGNLQDLQADIYLPASDTLSRRPLIIYCHGGSFTSGTRAAAWPVKFCQAFAKRGYATATIDYRLGIGSGGDVDAVSAQIRAVQDAKAAVRFFKQTAIEQGNPYRIDTAQIYIAGEASGAMIALQMAYLNSPQQFADFANVDVLTPLNGIEGQTVLPYSSKVKGVISLSGSMLDLNWLTNATLPLILVHGSKDTTIPYRSGVVHPYTATPLYGSYLIDSVATKHKFISAFHTFWGAGATPYVNSNTYADSTLNYVAQQMVGLIDCQRLGVH